ncbi:WhiB family transcriptional regulator [Streptomyces sp. NPDC006704]|uniref:WhiB family transcriptional regulator n=1 Tax=Streptomyces sp. NPDC006704 TaxID=3364760 RepID=UPI0036A8F75B
MALFSRKAAPDWSGGDIPEREAKCRKFPTPHTDTDDAWFDDTENAAAICNGSYDGIVCPLRAACLVQALVNSERYGCWGGLSQQQLGWMRKKYRAEPEKWTLRNAPPLALFQEGQEAL